jgi:hypothetical protein
MDEQHVRVSEAGLAIERNGARRRTEDDAHESVRSRVIERSLDEEAADATTT